MYKVQKHAKLVHISFRETSIHSKTENKVMIDINSRQWLPLREKKDKVAERHTRDFKGNKNVELFPLKLGVS